MKQIATVLFIALASLSFQHNPVMESKKPLASQPKKGPIVILFDVNETMLDMSPLKGKVNLLLGTEDGFRIWFGMLLQYTLVDNSTRSYHDFPAIADATLDMAAKTMGKKLNEGDKKAALGLIKRLKAYPDVEKGLKLLKSAGYRLATLTNSPMPTQTAQLAHAGLTKYFEQTLSIDEIKKYKPALETYQYAAKALGVNTEDMLMVAAHGWDLAGAMNAGMQTAFIERKGQALYTLAGKPHYMGKDLVALAKSIIKQP